MKLCPICRNEMHGKLEEIEFTVIRPQTRFINEKTGQVKILPERFFKGSRYIHNHCEPDIPRALIWIKKQYDEKLRKNFILDMRVVDRYWSA